MTTTAISQLRIQKGRPAPELPAVRNRFGFPSRPGGELLAALVRAHAAEHRIQELEKELERLSALVHQDQLTGALNRHGLDQAFRREAARAERCDSPLVLALLDVDDFKRLNDTYGHQAGDDALVHVARVLAGQIRPSDILCRFGGEEFLLLLPDTGLNEALMAMERLQRSLEAHPATHDGRALAVTFSAGLALRRREESRDALVIRADRALYRAKKNGKNRALAARS